MNQIEMTIPPLYLPGTVHSPRVVLDPATGTFEISGISLPENSAIFYAPILAWLQGFVAENLGLTMRFHFNLEYYNSGSKMSIYKLLKVLEGLPNATICWHYHPDDEDIRDAGHDLAQISSTPFQFIPI